SRTITVNPAPEASFTNEPQDETIECSEAPPTGQMIAYFNSATGSCTISGQVMSTISGSHDECGGSYTESWTFTDECNRTINGSRTITVNPAPEPEFDEVENITIDCSEGIPQSTQLTYDNGMEGACAISGVVTSTIEELNGNNLAAQVETRGISAICPRIFVERWSFTDGCNRTISASRTITMEDNEPPVIAVNPEKIIDCDAGAIFDRPVIRDNCDNNLDIDVRTQYFIPGEGCRHKRTWTVTDDCGNVAIASQIIIIKDDNPPILKPVHPLLAGLEDGDTMYFECNKPVYFSPDDFEVVNECKNCPQNYKIHMDDYVNYFNCENGTNALKEIVCWWYVTDEFGNKSTYTIHMFALDRMPPDFISVPEDKTIGCNDPVIFGKPVVEDACSDKVYLTHEDEIIQTEAGSAIRRTWTASDHCGNASTASQTITINGSMPVFTNIPEDKTLPFGSEPTFDAPTVNSSCGNISIQVIGEDVVSGNDCDGYTYTRTWEAVSDQGLSAMTSQTIEIEGDTEGPVITNPPADLVLPCDSDIPDYQLEATDNSGQPVEISVETTVSKGDCNRMGMRNWTVTDACGNSTLFTQMIYFTNESQIFFSFVPMDVTLEFGDTLADNEPMVVTNCEDEEIEMDLTVDTLDHSTCELTIQKTWIASDNCGNADTAYQKITFEDNSAPQFTDIESEIAIQCGEVAEFTEPVVTDNVKVSSLTFEDDDQIEGCEGFIQRTWTAEDACGNRSTFIQKIVLTPDITSPTFDRRDTVVLLNCNDSIPAATTPIVSDNCTKDVQVEFSENIEGEHCQLIIDRKWTATDSCGNISVLSEKYIQRDTSGPVFDHTPENKIVSCAENVFFDEFSATDNCTSDENIEILVNDVRKDGTCAEGYTIIRTWRAFDDCDNMSEISQTIQVLGDSIGPVLTFAPADTIIRCGDTIPDIEPVWTNNMCSEITVEKTVSFTASDTANCNNGDGYYIIHTWIARDICGTSDTVKQYIAVLAPGQDHLMAFVDKPSTKVVDCEEDVEFGTPVIKSTCDTIAVTYSDDTIGLRCDEDYRFIRTWTATDTCGQMISAYQTVLIRPDTVAPILTVLNDTLYMTSNEYESWEGYEMNLEVFDNCGIDSSQLTITDKEIDSSLAHVYTYEIFDNCMNLATDSFYVVVTDSEPQVSLLLSHQRIYSRVIGGQRPYQFRWEYQLLGERNWRTSDQRSDYLSTTDMKPISRAKLTVTDKMQHTATKTIELESRAMTQPYFVVFPNPAESYVNVNFDAGQEYVPASIRVFNMLGQQIFHREYGKELGKGIQNVTINTSDWPAGPYTLQLNSESMTKNQRLIITR
uniref:T9SS type A sorting domain-containing protein n=1 Tax=Membranihabitans maritimus TaxID=2904244 RepID=UPI001F3C0445